MQVSRLVFFFNIYCTGGWRNHLFIHLLRVNVVVDFPVGSVVKNLSPKAVDTGDTGSIPGRGRFPGEGKPTTIILPWDISPGQRRLAVFHGFTKSQT